MPIPSPADFRNRSKTNSQVREMLAQMASDVESKDASTAKADAAKNAAIAVATIKVNGVRDEAVRAASEVTEEFAARAELAASAAIASGSGKFYASISEAIEDTVDGDYFNIVSNNDEAFAELYKNVNGEAVSQEKSYPSAEKVNLISHAVGVTPRHFGGKPNDPEFDNKYALKACADSKLPIVLDGFYYTTEAPVFESDSTIKGLGETKSGIVKVGNNVSDVESVVVRPGVFDNYHVDAIMIVKGRDYVADGTAYAKNIDFESFSLKRYQCLSVVSVCYGLFAPRLAQSKLTKIPVLNTLDNGGRVGYAVRVVNGWMLSWDRVDATGAYDFHFGSDIDGHGYTNGGGTSNTFTSCWAAGAGKSAWRFYGYSYSNLISCGGDYIGNAENPADFVFNFISSHMGVINCSTEQVRGRLINANDSSSITFINPHFKHGIYGDGTLRALVHVSGNSRLNIIGGTLDPYKDATDPLKDATNPPYRAQYNSILRVQDVVESFTFSVSKTENVTDKTQVALFSGNSEFIHEKGSVKKCWAYEPNSLDPNYDENGYKTSGSIELTSSKSRIKLTNYDACKFTDPIQLGRVRIWRAVTNDAAALYFKEGADPTSDTDGTLLNVLRSIGEIFPASKIMGQYCYRTDLNKPFWWNGSSWRDANGSTATTKPSITGKTSPTTIAEQNAVLNSIVSALVNLNLVTDGRT